MKGVFYDTYAISFSDFIYKSICCRYLFELPQLVEAIQTGTYNICNSNEYPQHMFFIK